jgi:hypothetical protein
MVSNRDPKASCIDGRGESTYGSGGGNSGPVRSKPGRGRELLDLIAPVAVATAGVVGLAAAVSGLGMGLYKAAKYLKPVGQAIIRSALKPISRLVEDRQKRVEAKILLAHKTKIPKVYNADEVKRFADDDLAYGIAFGGQLDKFQAAYGGRKLREIGKPRDGQTWQEFSYEIMEQALEQKNKIHFNLDYMGGIKDILKNKGKYKNFITSYELRYLRDNWLRFSNNVLFYLDGEVVKAPWLK